MQEIIDRYLAAFNETDAARRRELLDALYTSESTYTDPHVDLSGPSRSTASSRRRRSASRG